MALSPALPDRAFATRRLTTATISAGSTWRRIYETRFPNPLGYGPGLSRFSDPTGKAFGLLYLGSSAKVAFVETILRDRADGRNGDCVIEESEIEKCSIATISPTAPLTLVDLTGDGPIKMGVAVRRRRRARPVEGPTLVGRLPRPLGPAGRGAISLPAERGALHRTLRSRRRKAHGDRHAASAGLPLRTRGDPERLGDRHRLTGTAFSRRIQLSFID